MRHLSASVGLLVLAFAVLAVTGCHHDEPPQPPVNPPAPVVAQPPSSPLPASPSTTGVIYVPQGDTLTAQTVPLQSAHPARDALRALCDADASPLPAGTRLRSIKVTDGLATCDFSHDLRDNFHGSETQEAQTVNAILQTLGQFPAIERVQILVDGKPIDALSQLPLAGPLDVIRPDSVQQARR